MWYYYFLRWLYKDFLCKTKNKTTNGFSKKKKKKTNGDMSLIGD